MGCVDGRPCPRNAAARPGRQSLVRRTLRYWVARATVSILARAYLRLHVDGRERLPPGPAIYCFNHLSWADPFVLMALLPYRPRLWFFGPKEEDMGVGGRNRVMIWTGTAIPYKPGKNDLLEATRRVGRRASPAADRGDRRRGADPRPGERAPAAQRGRGLFRDALRRPARPDRDQRHELAAVRRPVSGSGWGSRSSSKAGPPARRRPTPRSGSRTALAATSSPTRRTCPSPVAVGRWLTERFNDWPEGSREAALARVRPAAVWHTSSRPD